VILVEMLIAHFSGVCGVGVGSGSGIGFSEQDSINAATAAKVRSFLIRIRFSYY
jgi:hypothetical protein